jgi:hypothetical protein
MLFYSQTCGVKKYQSRQQAVLENQEGGIDIASLCFRIASLVFPFLYRGGIYTS